jgi:phosphocarrier protein HPr
MIRQSITIQNKLGLHTRAAAKLVDTAKGYQSHIELIFRDRTVDCKSIMGVITLGARQHQVLDVVVTGDDEEQAIAAVIKMIDGKFGEE